MNDFNVQTKIPKGDYYAIINSAESSNWRKKTELCKHSRLEFLMDAPVKIGDNNEIIIEFPYGICIDCRKSMVEIDERYKYCKGIYISSQKDL